jgi:hypothetical protein
MKFVLDCGAGKERAAGGHLVEDAAHAPHVDRGRVLRRAQQHVYQRK